MSGSPLKRFSVWSSVEVSEATEATELDRQNASVAREQNSAPDREKLPYRYLSPQSRQMWSKWQNLEKEAVVRESVMNRNVMLGQAFFIKALGHSQSECELYFDRVITQWVFDYIRVGDIDVAEDILTKAGYNATDKMKELCMNTSDVIARDYLIDYLTKKNAVDEDETDAWKFLRLIESALSSINYSKPTSELLSSGSSTYDCRHTNLPISLVMSNFPNWQNVVWADIFLNTHVNNYDSFVKPEIAWKILISRNDVSTISRWIANVYNKCKIIKQEVKDCGENLSSESIVSKELSQERAITFGITQDMVDSIALEDAIPEMKDEILDCLCQHGIYSTSEVGWKMFRRFSRAGLLPFLTDSWMNPPREEFHSNISLAALKQLANICIDNGFPEVLSICLPHHGETVEDVIEYFKMPPIPNAALNQKDEKMSWGVQVPQSSWADIQKRLDKYPPESWPPICSLQKPNCYMSVHDLLHGELPESLTLLGRDHLAGEGNTMEMLRQFSSSSSSAESQIDFLYYLRQARPTYAATAFHVDQITSHGSIGSDSISRACRLSQGLAMSTSPVSMVGAACAAFNAMIGGSPDMIRLYLAAGRMCNSNSGYSKGLQEPVVKTQTSDDYFRQLLTALESRKPAISVRDEHLGQLFTYAINVSLAKVSGQALPEALPRFFAENDLWLQFVLCLQIYRYPPEQVVSLVKSFKSNCLRDHLWHALQLVEPEGCYRKAVYYSRIGIKSERLRENSGREKITSKESSLQSGGTAKASILPCKGSDTQDGDMSFYAMLLRHHSRMDSLQPLPLINDVPPNPTLAVLETCVEGNSNLESLCKWLIGTCWNFGLYESWKSQKSKLKKVNSMMTDDNSVLEKQDYSNMEFDEMINEGDEHANEPDVKWTQDDALLLFQEVIRHGYFSLLSKGFYIFLPDSPLHPFTKSLAFAVEEMDFQKSLINLHYFKSQITDLYQKETQSRPSRMSKDAIWNSKSVVKISHSMVLSALSTSIYAPQQRLNLLGIFRQANLVEISSEGVADLDVLYGLQECLCKTGPEDLGVELDFSILPPLVARYPSEEWLTSLKNCLHQLIQKNHFSIALQFAKIAELPKDPVLIAEWKKNLESYSADLSKQRNPLHKDLNVTLGVSPVEACNSAFVTHGISPEAAARFFNSMANLMPSAKERYKMLKLALHWLGKANKVQFNLGAPDGNEAISLEMEEVELNMWKCRLELEMNEGLMTDTPEGPCLLSLQISADKIRRRTVMREQFSNISDTPSALGSLIGLHLDVGDLATAIRLESVFSHADRDISLLLTCMALAEGDMYPSDAEQIAIASEEGITTTMPFQPSRLFRPGSLQSLSPVSLKSHFMRKTTLPEDLSAMSKEQTDANCKVLAMLERIVTQLQRGKMLGIRIVTCFRLAFYLDMPYLDILNLSNPVEALCHHLKDVGDNDMAVNPQTPQEDEVKQKLTLASDILLAARLDRVGKAEFLQHEIVGAIQEFEKSGNTSSLSAKVLMWGISLDDNFPAILDLCEDDMTCSLLGDSLLLVANEQVSSQPFSHRKVVELLIRAHDCHSRACNMEGISRILRQARILTSSLLAAEEWSLMVRLLTGIKRYTEMNYIFLILKEHKQFEYVLGKGMDKVPGLKVALLDFLRRHCPGDKEYLWLVVLHFRLHSETAELWLSEAEAVINSIGTCSQKNDTSPLAVLPPERTSEVKLPVIQLSNKIMADLKLAIQNYTHAAEFYLQADQPIAASRCAHKAELVALQMYLIDASKDGDPYCVLHLEPLQIAAMVTSVLSFPQAWILVRAYEVPGNWAAAIYAHYVQGGDNTYLANFMLCKAVTPTLVEDIARRFLLDDGNTNQEMSQRMANLLTEMNDIEVCYRLSSRLGLWGLTGQLLTSPHLPYLRDVVWIGGTHNTR